MSDILSIGANAAQLYKSALATVGNNIANLNTDGYTRQVANSIENTPTAKGSSYIGSGARLVSVTRAFNEFTESNFKKLKTAYKNANIILISSDYSIKCFKEMFPEFKNKILKLNLSINPQTIRVLIWSFL